MINLVKYLHVLLVIEEKLAIGPQTNTNAWIVPRSDLIPATRGIPELKNSSFVGLND